MGYNSAAVKKLIYLNNKKKLASIGALLIALTMFSGILLLHPDQVLAQSLGDRIQNIQQAEDPNDFLSELIGLAITVAAMSLIGLGIFAGYIMITSQGNPEKINEAREILTNALIGFALITLSVAVLLIIGEVLGISALFE